MRRSLSTPICALITCLVLAACDVPVAATDPAGAADGGAAAEVARLQALGFRRTDGSLADGSIRLAYSGPINGAVLCAPRGGEPTRIRARSTTPDGRQQAVSLDAFVTLSPGADGVLQASERDGLYAVSFVTSAGAGVPATVQGLSFAPGGQGSLRSGLTCRAA